MKLRRDGIPGVDAVSVAAEARDDAGADAFAAVGSAEREARTPVGDAPFVAPAVGIAAGTRLYLFQQRTRPVVDGVADDGSPASSITSLTLEYVNDDTNKQQQKKKNEYH